MSSKKRPLPDYANALLMPYEPGEGPLTTLTIRPSLIFCWSGHRPRRSRTIPEAYAETLRSAIAGRLDALEKRHAGLLITIDETQAAERSDMIAIATAIYSIKSGERRNIAIVFAGLPQMISDLFNDEVNHVPTSREKRTYSQIFLLDEVRDAFATTFRASGMSITDAQLSTAANVTAGYPLYDSTGWLPYLGCRRHAGLGYHHRR